MKRLFFMVCLLVSLFTFVACEKSEIVAPVPAEVMAGAGADALLYPLPSSYEKGFHLNEDTGIFHMIEPFEQDGITRYAMLSGEVTQDNKYLTQQLTVTEGKAVLYAYDLRPLSLKVQHKEHIHLQPADMNFDGFIEFWVMGTDNDYYWLWNEETRTFERDDTLEALELGYPSFDEETKEISTYHGKKGEDTILRRVFQYRDGVPVLTGYTQRLHDEEQDVATTTVYELQYGEMRAVYSVSGLVPRYYLDEATGTFSLVQVTPSQTGLAPLCVTVTGKLRDENTYGREYYGKDAFIVDLSNGALLQKISLEETGRDSLYPVLSSIASDSLILEDINFDGFLDMRILYDGAVANPYYRYWTWDKKQGIFQPDEQLQALYLADLFVDAQEKCLISTWHESAAEYTQRVFEYIDDEPVLMKQADAIYDVGRDKVVTTIQERIGGEMEIVEIQEK